MKHVAIVILNYNSENDLRVCAEQMARQVGVRLSIILVDNASRPASLEAIRSWLAVWNSAAICGTVDEIDVWVSENSDRSNKTGCVYLIENNANRGYSAGNNIGIRLADTLKADAVLIANPDMRIENPNYLKELSTQMFVDPLNFIAASRILGLDGLDQNPLREASFFEEFFWPRWVFRRLFKPSSYVLQCVTGKLDFVPKVSGCCLLLRMDFLRTTNYLDENVFLYCEEPILSAKVHAMGGRILYVPSLSAVHVHISSEKGDKLKRMLFFIRSRKYYLQSYSGYNYLQLLLLSWSYAFLAGFNRVKACCRWVMANIKSKSCDEA